MKYLLLAILSLLLLFSCKKLKYGYEDTQFRNQFVGTYSIDSIFNLQPKSNPNSISSDSIFTAISLPNDYIEILPTEDQIEKNVVCKGKFLDSTFLFELQGIKTKGYERLNFSYCKTCSYSIVFDTYFMGDRYIVSESNNRLIIETRNSPNSARFYKRIYLTKR
ncbi:MAG TPA: hypothetical protein VGF79_11045 [Bacteroidia bacterium]